MASSFVTKTRQFPQSTSYRNSVHLRETLRRQRQQQLLTRSQSPVPWEILAWGVSAALLLWTVTYLALLPMIVGIIPLLHS